MIFFRKRTKEPRRQELKRSDSFIWQCFRLVLIWILLFALIITFFAITVSKESHKWAPILCSCICAIDGLSSLKICKPGIRMMRDPNYKESAIRRMILKMEFLALMNFKFSIGFIAWIWTSKSQSSIAKYIVYGCLISAILAIKIFFVLSCLKLKRFMSKLFVDFHKIQDEEPSEPIQTPPQHPLLETQKEEEVKLIE